MMVEEQSVRMFRSLYSDVRAFKGDGSMAEYPHLVSNADRISFFIGRQPMTGKRGCVKIIYHGGLEVHLP